MKILNKERTRKWLLSHRQAYLFSKIGWIAVGMKPKFIKNPKLQKIRERIKNKTQNKNNMENNKQETFYDRLIKERDELSDKLTKLEGFLSNPEKAKQISGETQFELLVEQSVHMAAYLNILDQRIIDLETSSSTI